MFRSRSHFYLAVLLFVILFVPAICLAQKEGNIWYFGENAGLDFNSGKPVLLFDGQVNSFEGCAAISDARGRLKFYTDGINVWNRKHQRMPNGSGLFGNPSSTQSGVIVPFPGDTNRYYIFTVDAEAGSNGFCYSTVDLRKDNGLGDVVQKNTQLFTRSTEKIAAVLHANGKDVWVIGHEWNSNNFRAYLVTSTGVASTPVISAIGDIHQGQVIGAIGQMTSSTDGSRIALASSGMGKVEIFDFDKNTGVLSDSMALAANDLVYGVTFSPDNTRLYYLTNVPFAVYQLDLTAGGVTEILQSRCELIKQTDKEQGGTLQIGPDGRIYVARFTEGFLDIIENPNYAGPACGYKLRGLGLNGRKSNYGLPAFIQSYFDRRTFTFQHICLGDRTVFRLSDLNNLGNVEWNFGDPQSGSQNTSTSFNPNHVFSRSDSFTVTLKYSYNGETYTISKRLVILPRPIVKLPKDTFLCDGASMTLDASAFPAQKYKWSNGNTAKSITIKERGKYWVEFSNGSCKASDTIRIFGPPDVPGTLGPDRILCPGQTVELRTDIPAKAYRWSDGSSDTTLKVSQAGTYWVDMILSCDTFRDSIVIFNTTPPIIELGKDTQLCQGDTLMLNASFPYATYLWRDSSNMATYAVSKTGTYKVTVTNQCGQTTDSIRVTYLYPPYADLGRDTLLCIGDSVVWDLKQPFANYLWQDGSTASRFTARTPGTYQVEVSNACSTAKASVTVEFEDCTCYLYAPTAFSPNGDNQNDSFLVSLCKTNDFLLQVYNRWGERVFESTDIKTGWDGKFKGQTVQEGVYLYLARARGLDKKLYFSKGQVTVVR